MSDKTNQIINAVCEAILVAADKYKKGEEFDIEGLQTLHESIRILHHIKKITIKEKS